MNIRIGDKFINVTNGYNYMVDAIQFMPGQLPHLIGMQSDKGMYRVWDVDRIEFEISRGCLVRVTDHNEEEPLQLRGLAAWLPSTRYEIEGMNDKVKVDFHDDISIPDFVLKKVCECGKEKHGFASHSTWCPVKE